MPGKGLTPKRVQTAKPKNNHYVIRDRSVKGLGMVIAPTGRKTYTLDKTIKGERHKETIGEAHNLTLMEAREAADKRIGNIAELHAIKPDTPFEVVVELALRRMERLWKPGTMLVNRSYLKNSIIPYFKGRSISSISRRDVEEWFSGLRSKPAAANRSAPVLSVVMRVAEDAGARPEGSNPVAGIRLYRRPKKERVLSSDEMARLGKVLDVREEKQPLQTAMVRLIILTGCRMGEIRNLHWRDYRYGHLHLPDSKTGAKTVYLSSHARVVLDGVETPRNGLVFPSSSKRARGIGIQRFWEKLRLEAGFEDVRLHDLRHTFASLALQQGASLSVIGTLLGHSNPETTLRYTHLDERMMSDAVETIGKAMTRSEGEGQ